jgi:hypothetical protein
MTSAPRFERRRIRLVDHALQKSLLAALVLMEATLAAASLWVLYRALAAAVEQNLYRVHFAGSVDMLSLLVGEGMQVLGAMLAVNVAALLAAHWIWGGYVNAILNQLGVLVEAAHRLDFSPRPASLVDHAVLEQALRWRAAEALHLAQTRARIAALPPRLPAQAPPRAAAAALLSQIRE